MNNVIKTVAIIIFITIFIGVASPITANIARQIFDSQTKNLTKEQKNSLTPGAILDYLTGGKLRKLANIRKVIWAGHEFETAYLDTPQYKTTGNKDIKFTGNGWYAPSYSLPRSKLLDINFNRKIKMNIAADFSGEMRSTNEDCVKSCMTTEKYHFSEFGLYLIDESGDKIGLRVLGTRHNVVRGNDKVKYSFGRLTVENSGDEIVVTDSTGFEIRYSLDFKYVTTKDGGREENRGRYTYSKSGSLHDGQKWFLGINCHVNGEGYCKLEVNKIQIL